MHIWVIEEKLKGRWVGHPTVDNRKTNWVHVTFKTRKIALREKRFREALPSCRRQYRVKKYVAVED